METNFDEDKFKRAKKHVDEIKGFYIHLTVYVIVNLFILSSIYFNLDGESFGQIGHFFTPFFWGIGLLFHGAKVFGFNPLFSKDWEDRQIKKYIDKDKDEIKKYK